MEKGLHMYIHRRRPTIHNYLIFFINFHLENLRPRGDIAKKLKDKLQDKCFNCNKFGHRTSEWKKPMNPHAQAHMTEVVTGGVFDINHSAMIFKVNMVVSNPQE